MKPVKTTAEILAFKALNRDIDKAWVDWAVDTIERVQPRKIHIPTIGNNHTSLWELHFFSCGNIVFLSIAHIGKNRHTLIKIQYGMQLYSAFSCPKLRPIKHTQTKVNSG